MSEDFILNAQLRSDEGKGASRRLRREQGLTPAVIYGDNKDAISIQLEHKELIKQLENEAFYSHVITINIGDSSEEVILKDLQRHPAKPIALHADFLRASKTRKLHTKVPLHFLNEETCPGVKLQGGAIMHNMTELDITCLAADLPEFIEIDLAKAEIGDIIHISDLNLPAGVESTALIQGADHDDAVVTIQKPKGNTAEEDEAEAEGGEEAAE